MTERRRPAPEPGPPGRTTAEGRQLPTLPAARSFVLRLRADADVGHRLAGRIEHVVTGRGAHFGSLAELLAFLDDVLRD